MNRHCHIPPHVAPLVQAVGRCWLLALLVGLVSALCIAAPLQAQSTPAQSLWRIYFNDRQELAALTSHLDVWEVNHTAGWLLAPLDGEARRQLTDRYRLALAPDQSPLMPIPAWTTSTSNAPTKTSTPSGTPSKIISSTIPGTIPGYACYRTVARTVDDLRELAAGYPQLAQIVNIGDSWNKRTGGSGDGHDLLALVLTNRQRTQPKFRFFLVGAIHARELATAETTTRFAEQLIAQYGVDPAATYLLDYGELHLLPIANPDGRIRAETGQLWRKNTNNTKCHITDGDQPPYTFGVDLNRNSSFRWNSCIGCSSENPCDPTYRGVAPASEPETQAIEAYVRTLFPTGAGPWVDSAGEPARAGLFISLHSYGEYVLYPWGYTAAPAPDFEGLQTLARKFGYYLGYKVCQAADEGCLYPTDGTTDDWAYGELGVPAYTIEQGTSFFQSCSDFESTILPDSLDALRYGFLAAAQPYHLPAGPEALDLSISSEISSSEISISDTNSAAEARPASTTIAITLTADDSRSAGNGTGNDPAQNIVAGRVSVNAPPWQPGTPVWPLSPLQETVSTTLQGNLQAACFPNGRHQLIAQAKDAGGAWGVPAAQFLNLDHPRTFQSTVHPAEQESTVGHPITYTLSLTNTSAVTAAYTISVAQDLPDELSPPQGGGRQTLVFPIDITLGPNEAAAFPVTAIPISNTADTFVPTVLFIRNMADETDCRMVHFTTAVTGKSIHLPLLHK